MSLFGTSPPEEHEPSPGRFRGGGGLFDDSPSHRASSSSLFDDGSASRPDGSSSTPWDLPTPRKQQSRAELLRNLLPASDAPDSYAGIFDAVVGASGRASADHVAGLFASARLGPEAQARIVSLVAPGDAADVSLDRNEFNVLLALVALAQEGDIISLDSVDERRQNIPQPKLPGLTAEPVLPPVAELAAKPPQTPGIGQVQADLQAQQHQQHQQHQQALNPPSPLALPSPSPPAQLLRPVMDDPEDDPWNTPDVHKGHDHSKLNGHHKSHAALVHGQSSFDASPSTRIADQSLSQYISASRVPSSAPGGRSGNGGHGEWAGYFPAAANASTDNSNNNNDDTINNNNNSSIINTGAFNGHPRNAAPVSANPFGGDGGSGPPATAAIRPTSGRTGSSVEENVVVTLMPGKEGIFMFQHHNYEVASQRRGSKVIRRYSDFVWLLDCLHKRYPFRALPLLPPKRVAVNGNHFSNDGSFIEKRRRGLARFLNALVRHPILSQEQLVVMFLTVPTELSVWRKQATISVQDELADKVLPPGLEASLPPTLEDLFARTRAGVRRSAELYINICNVMDRLVKRTGGVAADHARIAMSLTSLTESSADTYATDTNEVPLLNDGLAAMSKHLRTYQNLLEDESRGWDEGVLEDLKRQRDSLVSVRELFDRREKLDRDNIPYLERRIQANETKLAGLRSKPEGMVKPGEIEKAAEAIIKDKESIVQQHNRSVLVKECLRDELVTLQSSQYHVSRWNQDWAGERVKYAEMLADNWRRLLDELEGMPLGD
ncbi:uncharacterized protein UV8b_07820 [Ustilaginoidea virens]|uniref:Sorting nexin MVP1 n=1 Tax=Ustilaginoidea virens TaxID=1159556 RepID=A0A8E5HYL2_USTVR|nr:uncharacterized protein UV8b_07820 [Ustilaginoidea virens]QUC23579.1 hypothetical protein UV8b_07820 [Ustilaginoidea virens]